MLLLSWSDYAEFRPRKCNNRRDSARLPNGINPLVVSACMPGGTGCGSGSILLPEHQRDHEFGGKTILRRRIGNERDRAARGLDAFDGYRNDVVLLHYRQGRDNPGVLSPVRPVPAVCIRTLHAPLPFRDNCIPKTRKAPAGCRSCGCDARKIITLKEWAFRISSPRFSQTLKNSP